jgi:predicted nuclease of predicted toxin-antitoxin system
MSNTSALVKRPEIRLLLDENLPKGLVAMLIEQYDCAIVKQGLTNGTIARLAAKEKRIIVTQDKHFANIILFPPEMYCGIIRIKIHPPIIKDILKALEDLFVKLKGKDLNKKLVILEKDEFRIR